MLDLFRKRGVASVLYSALLGGIIVVFIIQFRPNASSSFGSLSRKCVAKVRGTCVDEKQWNAERFLLRGPYDSPAPRNYEKAAIEALTERTLVEQEAERLGVRVSDDEVTAELVRSRVYLFLPASLRSEARSFDMMPEGWRVYRTGDGAPIFGTKEKTFDQQTFEQRIRMLTGQNVPEFEELQKHELLAARMLSLVASRVQIGDGEAWDTYRAIKSTSTARSIRFLASYFAERFVPLDQASVDKWAEENKAAVEARDGQLPKEQERRLIKSRRILVASKKEDAADKRAEAKKLADDLLAQAQKPDADWSKLAKDHSADATSKDRGGEYEWTSGYEYGNELRDGLAKMKVNEVALIETPDGWVVAQVTGRMDGKTAVAFPLYKETKGGALAKDAAEKVAKELGGKLPVALDDALKAKVEEAKKGGKSADEATAQVLADEQRVRINAAIDVVLAGLATTATPPAPSATNAPGKPAAAATPALPAWQTDERKPHPEDGSPYHLGQPPTSTLDSSAAIEAASKLSLEAPIATPFAAEGDTILLVLKERTEAKREDFDKERATFMGALLAQKRAEAIADHLTALRDALGPKDLVIDAAYNGENKKGANGAPSAPIVDPEENP